VEVKPMRAVKKIEIIVNSFELQNIVQALEKAGVSAYSVIKDVTGKDERGVRNDDELTGVFKNVLVMTVCSEEQLSSIVEVVSPILKRYGGRCLISDAQLLIY